MSKFKFVIVSKDGQFSMDKEYFEKFLLENKDSDVSFVTNKDNINLTILYNKQLDEARKSKLYDFVVLLHSDVKLDLNHFVKHIEECKDKYDVFGLCGTQKISVSLSPLNWFAGSLKYPMYRYGKVCHGQLDEQVSYYNKDKPYITDCEVACIDGLCIVFGKKALDSELKFYEKLTFNCYDTLISFDAILKHKLKLGVIVEDSLQHFSIGMQIIDKEIFDSDEKILREYYNNFQQQ